MAASQSSASFDIVSTYRRLLSEDPELTMPVAAIESLVEAFAASQASTISETLTVLSNATHTLKAAIPNPISLSAGTDLFQRYLITTLRPGAGGDFDAIRSHLLSNGRLFVERAKASRDKIAGFGRHFIRDGATVLTNGGSRVVGAMLRSAADASGGSVRFRVIFALSQNEHDDNDAIEGTEIVKSLRQKGVPVATIPEGAVAYSMGKVDMVIVGAEGVVENGGIISRLGTYQMGILAKAAGKPFYVVAESHKFVRLYPLSQYDLPINQQVIDFKIEGENDWKQGPDRGVPDDEGVDVGLEGQAKLAKSNMRSSQYFGNASANAVDFTPPDLISGIITESGVLTPSAVSEELIKIWF
ncbi:translation initiation factor eIF-2B alpha subunit [Lineolata rhizophorae]|uniref:Translation initiation factor eIF2B subunit alpha n=1 Tax=Lineolata rhizophorae TaxID=578093 RepID=A0A6A6P4V6_9PEZI|nr:translation initiation factor eIF-2B alpha subunit [Lineolata rhizophorae]